MKVKSIAECSKGSILQYFRPSLSYCLSLRYLLCLFLSGPVTQVLLYGQKPHMNTYVDVPSRARGLNFAPSLHLYPCFVYASSEGSGRSAHLCRLTWAFVAEQCNKNQNLMCWLIWTQYEMRINTHNINPFPTGHGFCHMLSHMLMFLGSLYCNMDPNQNNNMDSDQSDPRGAVCQGSYCLFTWENLV